MATDPASTHEQSGRVQRLQGGAAQVQLIRTQIDRTKERETATRPG